MTDKSDALEALAGRRRCERHPEMWLEEGEQCGSCLVSKAPSNLVGHVMDAIEGKPLRQADLLVDGLMALLAVGDLVKSLPPTRPARKFRGVRKRLPRKR